MPIIQYSYVHVQVQADINWLWKEQQILRWIKNLVRHLKVKDLAIAELEKNPPKARCRWIIACVVQPSISIPTYHTVAKRGATSTELEYNILCTCMYMYMYFIVLSVQLNDYLLVELGHPIITMDNPIPTCVHTLFFIFSTP